MHGHGSTVGRPRRIIGQTFIVIGCLMLLASAATKLAHVPMVMSKLESNGITGGRVTFVALLEVLSALLFLAPATRSVGLPMVSAFMGGAIATHLQHGESIVGAALVLSIFWLGAFLRHPETLWSLERSRRKACEPAHRDSPAGVTQRTAYGNLKGRES